LRQLIGERLRPLDRLVLGKHFILPQREQSDRRQNHHWQHDQQTLPKEGWRLGLQGGGSHDVCKEQVMLARSRAIFVADATDARKGKCHAFVKCGAKGAGFCLGWLHEFFSDGRGRVHRLARL
jgi:hypothetical protein